MGTQKMLTSFASLRSKVGSTESRPTGERSHPLLRWGEALPLRGQSGETSHSSSATVDSLPSHGYSFTHFFARLLFRIASHSFTSWWPSAAVAKSTGVFRPLAMCS